MVKSGHRTSGDSVRGMLSNVDARASSASLTPIGPENLVEVAEEAGEDEQDEVSVDHSRVLDSMLLFLIQRGEEETPPPRL